MNVLGPAVSAGRRNARSGLGVDLAAAARGVHVRQPIEKRDELSELVMQFFGAAITR